MSKNESLSMDELEKLNKYVIIRAQSNELYQRAIRTYAFNIYELAAYKNESNMYRKELDELIKNNQELNDDLRYVKTKYQTSEEKVRELEREIDKLKARTYDYGSDSATVSGSLTDDLIHI